MNALRRALGWTSPLLLSIGIACSAGGGAPPSVTVKDLEALRAADAPPVLLDVRSAAEYQAGHIAGAIHIPHDELAGRLAEVPASEAGVVVYCQKGPRARKAELTLLEHGVAGVMHLQDGFSAWEAAGLPVER